MIYRDTVYTKVSCGILSFIKILKYTVASTYGVYSIRKLEWNGCLKWKCQTLAFSTRFILNIVICINITRRTCCCADTMSSILSDFGSMSLGNLEVYILNKICSFCHTRNVLWTFWKNNGLKQPSSAVFPGLISQLSCGTAVGKQGYCMANARLWTWLQCVSNSINHYIIIE